MAKIIGWLDKLKGGGNYCSRNSPKFRPDELADIEAVEHVRNLGFAEGIGPATILFPT